MARSVTIAAGQNQVQLPDGNTYDAGETAVLSDEQYAQIAATSLDGSPLIDNGPVAATGDEVVDQAASVAAPAALTSAQIGAAPTQANFNALQADVAALRTTLAAALTALKGAGRPMAP